MARVHKNMRGVSVRACNVAHRLIYNSILGGIPGDRGDEGVEWD